MVKRTKQIKKGGNQWSDSDIYAASAVDITTPNGNSKKLRLLYVLIGLAIIAGSIGFIVFKVKK
jgi:hypothetical protein